MTQPGIEIIVARTCNGPIRRSLDVTCCRPPGREAIFSLRNEGRDPRDHSTWPGRVIFREARACGPRANAAPLPCPAAPLAPAGSSICCDVVTARSTRASRMTSTGGSRPTRQEKPPIHPQPPARDAGLYRAAPVHIRGPETRSGDQAAASGPEGAAHRIRPPKTQPRLPILNAGRTTRAFHFRRPA